MQKQFLLTMMTSMIAGFGLMFVLVAIAYTRDIASIMRTPTLIWQYDMWYSGQFQHDGAALVEHRESVSARCWRDMVVDTAHPVVAGCVIH